MKQASLAIIMCLLVTGCGQNASKGAAQGASVGAVSGAVGGLITALVFGGDPAKAATRGAVYGGSVGATAGAMSGADVDARIAQERQAKEQLARASIGEEAFKGLSALATCDYVTALSAASEAKQSSNPNFSVAGYWLETLVYADQGDVAQTQSLLPSVVEKDWETHTEVEAKSNLLNLQDKLVDIRSTYHLPKTCS